MSEDEKYYIGTLLSASFLFYCRLFRITITRNRFNDPIMGGWESNRGPLMSFSIALPMGSHHRQMAVLVPDEKLLI